jgi:hypothetical protein
LQIYSAKSTSTSKNRRSDSAWVGCDRIVFPVYFEKNQQQPDTIDMKRFLLTGLLLSFCIFTCTSFSYSLKDSVSKKLYQYLDNADYQAINALEGREGYKFRGIILTEMGMMLHAYQAQKCYPKDIRYRNFLLQKAPVYYRYIASKNKALWSSAVLLKRSKAYWHVHNQLLIRKCNSAYMQKKLLNLVDYFNTRLGIAGPITGSRHVGPASIYARLSTSCYVYKKDYAKYSGYMLRNIRSWCNCLARNSKRFNVPPPILKPFLTPENFNAIVVSRDRYILKVMDACVRR